MGIELMCCYSARNKSQKSDITESSAIALEHFDKFAFKRYLDKQKSHVWAGPMALDDRDIKDQVLSKINRDRLKICFNKLKQSEGADFR